MFKSLLRTIPTISGNFTLACKVNDYVTKNNTEYTAYIDDAILMPLDNKYSLDKDIKINLTNSKYEYDVMKYYKEMSSYFYNDTYLKNQNIFEQYIINNFENDKIDFNLIQDIPDNRDKNFEFGCKHISYNKYKYQYQFFAPIYINSVDDLPDSFVINIYTNNNTLVKKINIPITSKRGSNKLRIYLTKFIEKLENNVPVVWNFGDNKIIYQKSIDCKNGGFVDFINYNTLQSNNINQTIINDIDNLICQGYKDNGIIISECIPLSFIFNLSDILKENDLYYFNFNQFNISGYYMKNGINCDFYDFSYNYHNNYSYYVDYINDFNRSKKKLYNLFDNNIIYSLKEGTNYYLYYQNTFKKTYFQWKLNESNNYIININSVFSYNDITNKFPILKNSLLKKFKCIVKNDNLYLPINNFANFYNLDDQNNYSFLLKNNFANWFNIYSENSVKDLYSYYPILNGKVFINGVDYVINDNIKYFNIFINPIPVPYIKNLIKGNIIIKEDLDNNIYKYENISNNYYVPLDDEQKNKLNDEDIVYINDELVNNICYIEYYENFNTNLFSDLIDSFKIIEDITNIELTDKEKLSLKDNLIQILRSYFSIVEGYEKLDIKTSIFTNETDLFDNFFKNNSTNKYKIYYSKTNTTEKNNLYYDLNNKRVDYDFLKENNITYFRKTNFLKIGDYLEFYNNIFDDQQNLKLFNKYVKDFNNKSTINDLIDKLKDYLLNNDEKYEENKNFKYNFNLIKIKDLASIKEKINNLLVCLNEYKNSITQDVIDNANTIIYYYSLFQLLNYRVHFDNQYNDNKYQLYKYIYYDNQDNIIVNNDYFEKIYNNEDYQKLYFNQNNIDNIEDILKYNLLNSNSNNSNIEECYIYIDNFETFDYLRKLYGKKYINENMYIRELVIDKTNSTDIDYILYKFDINYLKKIIYIDNVNLDNYMLNYSIKDLDVYTLLSEKLVFNSNQASIDLDVRSTEETIKIYNINIKLNLYIKLNCLELTKSLFEEEIDNNNINNTNKPSYIIYKESKENTYLNQINKKNKVISCNIIYNNISKYNYNPYEYQIIKKNLNLNGHTDKYVYKDPYNTLLKLEYKRYKEIYHDYQAYIQSEYINNYNVRYEYLNKDYGYLCIDYYFMLSTNTLNVYNIDDNDNFIISKINDINIINFDEYKNQEISSEIIKSLFRNIYPYLKQDLFIELLNIKLDKIQIIIPHTIKCNINTIIKRKPNEDQFTNISLSKNIVKKIYLNRYFGNISPLFKEIDNSINYERSKIYIISDDKNININSENNNVFVENINLYQYNPIKYFVGDPNKTELQEISQIEYKHFNNNQLFNFPTEILLVPDDIDYIKINQLNEYETEEKCFEYFKKYIDNNFIYKNRSLKEYYFLFKKYNINYIHEDNIVSNVIYNTYKIYQISYKLILI